MRQQSRRRMKRKQWPFGKKQANINSETLPAPAEPVLLSLYSSIHSLPLHRFIDCIVDGNLHSLIITGKPTELDLQDTWNNILSEYTEAIGNNEYRLYISLYKEVSQLKITYSQILNAVNVLRVVHSKFLCDELNRLLSQQLKFDWNDQQAYQEELAKCLRRSKSIKISIDLKIIQFEGIQKKHTGDQEKYTREYFDSVLINLSDHAKYEINESITVGKYCQRIKRFTKHIETLKKK